MSQPSDFRLIRPVDVAVSGAGFTSGAGTYYSRDGTLSNASVNVLRVSFDPVNLTAAPRPLIEPDATNVIRNNTMQGAIAGSPGALPTNWFVDKSAGQSSEVVGVGQEGGIDYIDIRLYSVSNDRAYAAIYPEPSNGTGITSGVAAGQVWAASLFTKLMAGALGSGQPRLIVRALSSAGSMLSDSSAPFQPAGNGAALRTVRASVVSSPLPAGSARLAPFVMFESLPLGVPLDFTVRIGLPQLQRDAVRSPIRTSGTAVTRAADTFTGTGLAYCNAPVTEAAYSAGTTYAKDAKVILPATGETYQSLVAGNLGHSVTDPAYWLALGPTNRALALDKAVNTQTTNPDLLVFAIVPGALVSDVVLLNTSGARATVEQPATGYRRTINLVSHPVTSWYEFFAEQPFWVGDAFFENLIPHAAGPIIVIVEAPGTNAGLGCCFMGKSKVIGETQNGLEGGVNSFSTTKTDAQGNMRMVRRPNARRMTCDVYVPPGLEDMVYRLLSEYTDVELVVVASSKFTMTYQYGYLGQWSVPLTNNHRPARIEFKGLI